MKTINLIASFFFITLLISCSKDDTTSEVPEQEFSGLLIASENISHTTVKLDWDAVKVPDSIKVIYDIYLEGIKVRTDNEDTDFTLTRLEHNTTYTGEIIAKNSDIVSRNKTNKGILQKIPFLVKTIEFQNNNAPRPNDFLITVVDALSTTVTLEWDKATITDDSEIRYDIYVEGDKIGESSNTTSFTITQLESSTTYAGEIIAISTNEKTKNIDFSFTTKEMDDMDIVPSDFIITIEDIQDDFARLLWEKPSIEDNSEILYDIYMNEELIRENNDDPRSQPNIQLNGLIPNTSYSGRIVAKSSNGTSKSMDFSFATHQTITLSDFSLTIENITYNSARLTWTTPVASDNSEVFYKIRGVVQADSIIETFFQADDLRPSTRYVISVKATAGTDYQVTQFTQQEFITLESPIDNPDISFPLSHTDRGVIEWVPPIAPDGEDFTYNIYERTNLIESDLPGTTSSFDKIVPVDEFGEFTLQSYRNYDVEVEAVFADGSIAIEKLSFNIIPPPPSPVENLLAENITATTAIISWDESYTVSGGNIFYNVYLNGNLISPFSTHFETSYTLENLTPVTSYNVTVEAVSEGEAGDPVDISFSTTEVNGPSNFIINITDIRDTFAALRWEAPTTADNSDITYDIFLEGEKVREDYTDHRVIYSFNRLEANTSYSGSVVAKSSNGTSTSSDFSFRTAETIVIPDFPVAIESITSDSATITWTAPSVSDNSNISYRVVVNESIIVTDTFFQLDNLRPDTSYHVIVEAIAGDAYTVRNAIHNDFTTLASTVDNPDISFPLTHVGNGLIQWTPPIAPDGEDFIYNIYNNTEQVASNVSGSMGSYDLELFGALDYGDYTVEVEAVFANGSIAIEKLNFRIDPPPPTSVENLSIENITTTTATATWYPSYTPNGGIIYYNVYLNGNPVTNMYSYYETSYTFENLIPGISYNVTVEAVSDGGLSDPTDIVFSTLPSITPSDFSINIQDITTESATLTWTSSTTTGNEELFYNIMVNSQVERNQVTGNSFLLENLCPNTSYSISITATTATGETSNPIVETFTTTAVVDNPSIVFPLSITPQVSGSQIQIVWTTPIAPDSQNFTYTIYVDNRLGRTNIPGEASNYTMSTVVNNAILESGDHTLKMIAFFSDGTTATELQTFKL